MAPMPQSLVDFIARSTWFEGLPSAAVKTLADRSVLKSYKANDTIYLVNESANTVFGILDGAVRLSVCSTDGQEFVLTHLGPESWFGEAALVGDRHRVQEARVKQTAQIVHIPSQAVLQLAEEYPVIYKNLFAKQLRRTRAVYDILTGSLFYPLKARVAGRFVDLVRRHGRKVESGIVLDFPLSQNEFANMTMGSRQRVNKIFREWVRLGILSKDGSRYIVKDLERLEQEIVLPEAD